MNESSITDESENPTGFVTLETPTGFVDLEAGFRCVFLDDLLGL